MNHDLPEENLFPLLPLEILLHIFGFVKPGSGTRISILRTSKDIRDTCLYRIWKPWDDHGRGLRKAVSNGYIGYFRRWKKISPDSRWLFFSKGEESVLVTAATKGFLDFVKMFVRGPLGVSGGPLDPSVNNWLAFRRACAMQRIKVVRFFLNKYDMTESCLNECLFFACKNGHYKTVKVLLEDEGCDPSIYDSYCLKKACKYGHTKVVELLLDDGRSDPNAGGGLPIYYAHHLAYPRIYEALCIDYRTNIPRWLREADPEGWWVNSDREETSSEF